MIAAPYQETADEMMREATSLLEKPTGDLMRSGLTWRRNEE